MPEYTRYYSQAGQDGWVIEMTDAKMEGFYIDLGAHNGVASSNTYCLDKVLNWKGICIEAHPEIFQHLVAARPNAINVNYAVSDYIGTCYFGNDQITRNPTDKEIKCTTLYKLLKELNAPQFIDYLSIDIEGSEVPVLKKFFEENDYYTIDLITAEHNLYCWGSKQKDEIYEILASNGYERVVEDALCKEQNPMFYNQPYEDWYKKIK